MKTFDEKWHECASRARSAHRRSDEVPFGFANRVLSRRQTLERRPRTGDALWMQFSLRTLFAMSAVLVVFALVQWNAQQQTNPLRPAIESTVLDYSKLL